MVKYTLITGATSGLGLELARIYAAKAENLILVARREEIMKSWRRNWQNAIRFGFRPLPAIYRDRKRHEN